MISGILEFAAVIALAILALALFGCICGALRTEKPLPPYVAPPTAEAIAAAARIARHHDAIVAAVRQ